ncbi:MAG: hypothetical protein A2Z83_06650 [Omnitrophica bacterium GWA2_52_8]|nr:MAG: hypothetical protein A2Z83_06650 [Omnitrophica bacterium GWA2_52_8]
MFAHGLILIAYVVLAALSLVQSHTLPYRYYIFASTLPFPIYYFWQGKNRVLGAVSALLLFFVSADALMTHGSRELWIFFCGFITLGGFFVWYQRRWESGLRDEEHFYNKAKNELQQMEEKFTARMESLRHLENQVAGLLDLFESAKDFSECLNFDKLVEILQKKVQPQIPFDSLKLIVFDRSDEGKSHLEKHLITGQKVISGEVDLLEDEMKEIENARTNKKLVEEGGRWTFPLFADERLVACVIVSGAAANDLAKFEVLSAFLALQVKKIQLYLMVRELSIRDSLTGLFIRRHFMERFEEEMMRSRKFRLPLSLLMLDIDHFKRYNDDHGHLAGDATLKQVASLLRQNLRKVDILARYGGEEFIIVIPEAQRKGALEVAERIRSNIARHDFKTYHHSNKVTVSIGIALYPDDIKPEEQDFDIAGVAKKLINSADQALYLAKEEGRNRVVLFQDL